MIIQLHLFCNAWPVTRKSKKFAGKGKTINEKDKPIKSFCWVTTQGILLCLGIIFLILRYSVLSGLILKLRYLSW